MTHSTPGSRLLPSKPTVYVPNADGFVESHLVSTLLARGFPVRASLGTRGTRDAAARVMAAAGSRHPVEYVPPGSHLASEWKRALGSSEYAVQVSPRVARALPNPQELTQEEHCEMEALRQAARSKGIKCVDIAPTELPDQGVQAIQGSPGATGKFTSIRDLMAPIDAAAHLRLRIPCPMGPLLDAGIPGSMEVLKRLLDGRVRRIPRLGYEIVDIRDVMNWLVDQLGEADLVQGDLTLRGTFLWMADLAETLRRRFPQFAHEIPDTHASDAYVLSNALFNPEARRLIGSLGKCPAPETQVRNEGGNAFRTRHVGKTLIDAARSLILLNRGIAQNFIAPPSGHAGGWES